MRSDEASDFFECTQCGTCCKGYGGTYVGSREIAAMADYLKMPAHIVKERFCTPSGNQTVLTQRADGYCIFWDQNCTIHPVKPLMCRRWPFIPSLLVDAVNWRIMAVSCPGIRREIDVEALLNYTRAVIGRTGQ
jgi:uncharacterized protein